MSDSHLCRYGCGKTLVYDADLKGVPFRESDTGLHHTYKRCGEILGPEKATEAFAKGKKKTTPEGSH